MDLLLGWLGPGLGWNNRSVQISLYDGTGRRAICVDVAMIEVYLDDRGIDYDFAEQHFLNADIWARENCGSYRGYNVQDVSDFSYVNDWIAQYLFEDERDVLIFTLRWR